MGVFIGSYLTVPIAPMLLLLATLVVVTVFCYLKEAHFTGWLLLVLCLLLGVFHINMWDKSQQTNLVRYLDQRVTITSRVVREPDVRPDKVIYQLEVDAAKTKDQKVTACGLVRLTVYQTDKIFNYGDIIEVQGKLQSPQSPGNPGQFDYQQYLKRQGIQVTMSVWQGENIKRIGQVDSGAMGWGLKVKGHFLQVLADTLPAEQSALMQGMLFGTRGMIAEDIDEDFQTTSLVHILSVSGFHVAVILGACLFLMHALKVPLKLQAPISTVLIIFYSAITGFGPTVLRSAVMGLMVVWARYFGRERDWPTAMALAVVVILFASPKAMWEPGFQLSFIATWGILYLVPTLEKLLSNWPKALVVAASVPIVAELTVVPLVAYHFNMMSLVGIITNILTAPLITAVMLLSGISVLVGVVLMPLASIINVSTGLLLDILLWLVRIMASLPHAAIYLPSPPWWGIIAYYLFLARLPQIVESKENKHKYLIWAGAILSIVVILTWIDNNDNYLTVHFIDVGQGDAALVQTPNGRNMLIDTGGWSGEFVSGRGAGTNVVLPYLQRLGINNLDALILSHPHEDHCGGAHGIIDKLPVRLVIVTPFQQLEEPDDAYIKLLGQMNDQGLTVMPAEAGQMLQLDKNLDIMVMSPTVKQTLNNSSLVVKINYQQASFLFTGDIEKEQQQILVGHNMQSDVLKVPHHGSGNFSSDFLKSVAPKIAVISVGEKNRFGHPDAEVLTVLTELNAKTYRTDIHGAVIINTDGRSIWVDTGRKSE
jgi:competence protein ComEC